MFDITNFSNFVSSLDVQQLQAYLKVINNEIVKKLSPSYVKTPKNVSRVSDSDNKQSATDLVEYEVDFLSKIERDSLYNECKSLNFNRYTSSDAVQNKFLSPFSEPYIWDSVKGPVVNKAIAIDDFPVVKDILAKVNTKFESELNCVLISYYKNGSVNCRLHRDDEASLDASQPIVVVSIGATRRVEFLDNDRESWMASDLILDPTDCSMYVMHAGCQQNCRHRVRMDKKVHHERLCFSFRAFVPAAKRSLAFSTPASAYRPPAPKSVKSDPLTKTLDFHTPNAADTPNSKQASKSNIATSQSPISSKSKQPVDPQMQKSLGYSPFPDKGVSFQSSYYASTESHQQHSRANSKYCILFGTSITRDINSTLMSKGNRKFINCSTSGANIYDISKLAQDFYHENSSIIDQIDKIIISVGTNDIKFFNGHKYDINARFRPHLINLVKSLKHMYPHAQIIFQCVLPIRVMYNYTASSVEQFNRLLFNVCERYGCIFFDCFDKFLDGWDYNKEFYRDSFHLNEHGLKLLCRDYKYIVHRNVHNPYPRICLNRNIPYPIYY